MAIRSRPEALTCLSIAAAVPLTSLSTLSVTESAGVLYSAIAEYAVLHGLPDGTTRTPHLVTSMRRRHEHDPNNGDDEADHAEYEYAQHGRPAFKLGFAEKTVTWPPPAHLRASVLAEAERVRLGLPKRAGPAVEDAASVLPEGTKLHIVHMSLGEPRPSNRSGLLVAHAELVIGTIVPDAALRAFCSEVVAWMASKEPVTLPSPTQYKLYRFRLDGGCGNWSSDGRKRARPSGSVILANGLMDAILADVTEFLSAPARRWYIAHGLPQRRAFLFFGPPGTGKTSTIRVLASTFRLACCFLSMANGQFSNQALGDALASLPPKALIVIEDVDALFSNRRSKAADLTFSGLLNALDGLMSADGTITVMTTNHVERLDEALLRAGRVDRRFYFGHPSDAQLVGLFRSFYPGADDATGKAFVKAVDARAEEAHARSIATLQQLFIAHRESTAAQCVAAVPQFFETYFPAARSDAAVGDGKTGGKEVEKGDGNCVADEDDEEEDPDYDENADGENYMDDSEDNKEENDDDDDSSDGDNADGGGDHAAVRY